jgi:hypothetical protein
VIIRDGTTRFGFEKAKSTEMEKGPIHKEFHFWQKSFKKAKWHP